VSEKAVADYFEASAALDVTIPPKTLSNWICGEIFAWLNQNSLGFEDIRVPPARLVELIQLLGRAEVNLLTAKNVLAEMLNTGKSAGQIVAERGLGMISDSDALGQMVRKVLDENPRELASYLAGKETLANWFFGQVMRLAKGQANPFVVRTELEKQLKEKKEHD
jgi:aspartyl-tRNA(Asn)/glutamyl-tRNA(Gln) amidotransferase subunit B